MAVSSNPDMRVVFYEGRGSETVDATDRFAAMRGLLDAGYATTRSSTAGSVSDADERHLVVMGRLGNDAGGSDFDGLADNDSTRVAVRDLDKLSSPEGDGSRTFFENVLAEVDSIRDEVAPQGPSKWKPWFPVIDFDRCTHCMQCLSFCLFDVYSTTPDGKITVQNEDNCKTDCPACSRVCPEVAILFPKYRNGPINGDEISTDDVRREQMKVDISSLLGGDIYAALKDRSAKAKSRFSKERDEDKALKERMRCLTKLSEGLDIPAEVMSSLPSPSEIKERAEEAQRKANRALSDQNQTPDAAN